MTQAGKTTLMNILFGIYQADEGEILYKGETVLDNIILGLGSNPPVLDRGKAAEKIAALGKNTAFS